MKCYSDWTDRFFWWRCVLDTDFDYLSLCMNPGHHRGFVSIQKDGTAIWSA